MMVDLKDMSLDICPACRRGHHDFCHGSCQDCGERYHADPDDFFWLDRDMAPDYEPADLSDPRPITGPGLVSP